MQLIKGSRLARILVKQPDVVNIANISTEEEHPKIQQILENTSEILNILEKNTEDAPLFPTIPDELKSFINNTFSEKDYEVKTSGQSSSYTNKTTKANITITSVSLENGYKEKTYIYILTPDDMNNNTYNYIKVEYENGKLIKQISIINKMKDSITIRDEDGDGYVNNKINVEYDDEGNQTKTEEYWVKPCYGKTVNVYNKSGKQISSETTSEGQCKTNPYQPTSISNSIQ